MLFNFQTCNFICRVSTCRKYNNHHDKTSIAIAWIWIPSGFWRRLFPHTSLHSVVHRLFKHYSRFTSHFSRNCPHRRSYLCIVSRARSKLMSVLYIYISITVDHLLSWLKPFPLNSMTAPDLRSHDYIHFRRTWRTCVFVHFSPFCTGKK